MIITWCMGVEARNDHGKPRNDHGSRMAKRPIKIRNEKRTKRTNSAIGRSRKINRIGRA